MRTVKTYINELDKIEMRPRLSTDEDYIQQMIKQEEEIKKQGWKVRKQQLEYMVGFTKHTGLNSLKVE